MKRITRGKIALTIVSLALVVFFVSPLWGQIDTGRVAGTVKDPSGAVLAHAQLTLTNQGTGIALKTESSDNGTYIFQAVPVGVYTLKAATAGFKAHIQKNIEVHVQSTVTADIALEVGGTTQEVTVTAAAPLLQAEDASVGQTITATPVNDLPLNGRNWLQLAQLTAGSYFTGSLNTNPSGSGNTPIMANGTETGQVDFRLNGVNNNAEVFGGVTVAPVPDAIQEFKLQAGDNSAEFGHSAGAVVNAVVKSGTNRIRGNAWEYFRNEALNANDYLTKQANKPRPTYRQNQFGGTIGGPLSIPGVYNGKNKTFFFADYQRTQVNAVSPSTQYIDTVPTQLMRDSNFTNLSELISGNTGTGKDVLNRVFAHGTVLDPATTRGVGCGVSDAITGLAGPACKTGQNPGTIIGYVRDPLGYTGSLVGKNNFTSAADIALLNQLPAGRLDPNAVKLLKLLPAPNQAGLKNNYFLNALQQTHINQFDVRVDHNISSKDSVFGVFSRSTIDVTAAQPFPGPAMGALQMQFATTQPTYLLALSETHLFSPTLINEVRFGYNHNYNTRTEPDGNTMGLPEQYGILGIPQIPNNGGLPTINLSGYNAFGSRRYTPTLQTTGAQDYTDNVTKIAGSHEFKFGVQVDRTIGHITQPAYSRGNVTYNGQYTDVPDVNSSMLGISDFLLNPVASRLTSNGSAVVLGGPSGWNGSNYAGTNYNANYYGAYTQDRWKVTQNLTLTLGLRWEFFAPYNESDGGQANFVMQNNSANGAYYYIADGGCNDPRSAGFNSLLQGYNIQTVCMPGNTVNRTQKTNFAPRLGIAYRVLPKLVVRAGYGIAYGAFDSVGYGGTMGTNYPFQYILNSPSTTSQTPLPLSNGQPATIENIFVANNLNDPSLVTGKNLSLSGKTLDYKTPYTQNINLTTQYQFSDKDSIQVGYVGTLGRHLDSYRVQNSPSQILPKTLPAGTTLNNYIPFPNLAANGQLLTTTSRSDFHSLQATYEHRFSEGLSLMANYTHGKCMANNNKNGMGTGLRALWLPGMGEAADYVLCSSDAAHLAHVAGQYALPFGKGKSLLKDSKGVVNALIGGWQLNYIFTYQSGQPFTVGCPTATTTGFGCNALLVAGQDPYGGPHDQTQWLNPAAFANPPAATTIGQTDYSPLGGKGQQVRGPSYTNLDSSLFKQFATTETTKLEFRFEVFNIFNTAQFGQPGSLNFTTSGFSKITSLRGNPRIGQLALKFYF